MRKKNMIIILFSICLCFFFIFINRTQITEWKKEIKIAIYGEPIDEKSGIINNQYFGIDSNGTNAKQTTKGICNAIEYANENNIEYVKLEEGKYLINGEGEKYKSKGIVLKSNITLDLNNSTIIHENCSSERYTIINLYDVENVTVCNGHIIGDRDEHDYNTIQGSHQWGYGVEINGSSNIQIHNLQIEKTTGDGIIVAEANENGRIKTCNDIEIKNNNIFCSRRQGISVITGTNINIYQNEIHQISGAAPQTGIDLESDFTSESIENVKIYDNIFYGTGSNIAVQLCKYIKNVEISNNNIQGKIVCYNCNEKFAILNNIISNGGIELQEIYGIEIKNIEILNNKIINSHISIKDVHTDELQFEGNKLENTSVENNFE